MTWNPEQEQRCTHPGCGRPSDGWFVCTNCANLFTNEVLGETAWMFDELNTVITGQTQYTAAGSPKVASSNQPLPINLAASAAKDLLAGELEVAVKVIAGANKWPRPQTTPTGNGLWLGYRISAIRLHPAGGQMMSDIRSAYTHAVKVIDMPEPKQFLGDCAEYPQLDPSTVCPGKVYARGKETNAVCDTCRVGRDAEELRSKLLTEKMNDEILTASEIARLATYLGHDIPREKIRHRIHVWANRGLIEKLPLNGGEAGFRLRDVLQRLQESAARKHA